MLLVTPLFNKSKYLLCYGDLVVFPWSCGPATKKNRVSCLIRLGHFCYQSQSAPVFCHHSYGLIWLHHRLYYTTLQGDRCVFPSASRCHSSGRGERGEEAALSAAGQQGVCNRTGEPTWHQDTDTTWHKSNSHRLTHAHTLQSTAAHQRAYLGVHSWVFVSASSLQQQISLSSPSSQRDVSLCRCLQEIFAMCVLMLSAFICAIFYSQECAPKKRNLIRQIAFESTSPSQDLPRLIWPLVDFPSRPTGVMESFLFLWGDYYFQNTRIVRRYSDPDLNLST